MRFRIFLGAIGVLLLGYGAYRIIANAGATDIPGMVKWLVLAVVLHDGVLTPLTLLLAAVLAKVVPGARARRYLQGALVAGALVTVVAVPMIYRRGTIAASKALLQQDYGLHLAALLGLIAAVAIVAYALSFLRSHIFGGRGSAGRGSPSRTAPAGSAPAGTDPARSATNVRPAEDQTSESP